MNWRFLLVSITVAVIISVLQTATTALAFQAVSMSGYSQSAGANLIWQVLATPYWILAFPVLSLYGEYDVPLSLLNGAIWAVSIVGLIVVFQRMAQKRSPNTSDPTSP